MNYPKIILELEKLKVLKKQNIQVDVSQYEKIYLECRANYSKLCEKCIAWKKLDLPIDCICKPDYCLKKEDDYKIITLYEYITRYCR